MSFALPTFVKPITIFTSLYHYRRANKVSGIRIMKPAGIPEHHISVDIIPVVSGVAVVKKSTKKNPLFLYILSEFAYTPTI